MQLFKKYLASIPEDGPFYRKPKITLRTVQFTSQNVGVHTLSKYIQSMFASAMINTDNRRITGHSGKVTLCTRLYNAGFDEQMVKLKSGHRSDAVRRYQRPSQAMRQAASDALLNPKKRK